MAASTTPTARKPRAGRTARPNLAPVPEPTETPQPVPGGEETPNPTPLAAVPSETPKQATPALKAQPKPAATIDLGARQVRYWFPSATLADGSKVECGHSRYGHEGEAAAKRCIAQLVAQRGHRVG